MLTSMFEIAVKPRQQNWDRFLLRKNLIAKRAFRLLIHALACVGLILSAYQPTWSQKPEIIVQTGHSNTISSVVFSPDGKLLATVPLGHGYLTYALVVEGLKNGAADYAQKDNRIFIREWLDYGTEN